MGLIKQVIMWPGKHPIKVMGVTGAALMVAKAFGAPLSAEQTIAIETLVGALVGATALRATPPGAR